MNKTISIANKNATLILKSFFNSGLSTGVGSVLINNPIFLVSQTNNGGSQLQITVQLSYYMNLSTGIISSYALKTLTNTLTAFYESIMEQPVNVQLELVRQYQPYMDASILAQYLAINASGFGFNRMMNSLLNAVPFLNPKDPFFHGSFQSSQMNPVYNVGITEGQMSYITGIKVQLSGLLTSQRNRSRKTVYSVSAGTLNDRALTGSISSEPIHNNNMTMSIDHGSYTSKSRLGAFTVKVWIAVVS